jgi:transposase
MAITKRMDQVRQIIKTFLNTDSIKATARRMQVSKNTIRGYVRRGKVHCEDLSQLLLLEDAEFLEVFYPSKDTAAMKRKDVFRGQIDYWIKELRRVGVTRHLLWEEYLEGHPGGYSYSQFCEYLKREVACRDLTISLNHIPGEVMQVDFAGKKMSWVDVATGEVHQNQVLVVVMPHSQYTFATAVASQKVADFIHGLNQALLYFGKLPKVILSDNLKSYVIKSDKYDPTFNDLCVQLAAHYQIDLDATRVRKPKVKASVENMVGTVYTRIYAPLRNEIFHSLEELNAGIFQQLTIHNNKPYQQKQGTRHAIFHTYEEVVMKNLPSDLLEIKKTATAQVRRNYHVLLGQDNVFYSVSYKHAKETATMIYTSSIVEIYIDNQRVGTHKRLYRTGSQQYQTKEEHMPKSHLEWRKSQGFNAPYFLSEAEKIGPATRWGIQHILLSRIHEAQSYNSCQGLLSFGKKYSPVRLENATLRCQKVGKVPYHMVKNILVRKLDMASDQLELFNVPKHENIRGPEAYQ